MLRAQNIAIVYLLIFLVLLIQQRFRWLALVAFVFLQSYHGALIVLIPVAIYFLASGLRLHHWRWDLLLAVATGFTAALVINPWFPSNIEYLWFHTAFKVLNPQNLQVGPEWDSKTWALIYSEAWASHWLLLTGIAMSICYQRELLKRPQVFTLLAFTLFTLVLYKFAYRFSEYYVPTAILTAAVLWSPYLSSAWPRLRWVVGLVAVSVGVMRIGGALDLFDNLPKSRFQIYQGIVAALDQHAAPGSLIFNAYWDDFPYLLWHSTDFRYVNGLDPHYLAYSDPERFELWNSLTGGARPPRDPVSAIREGLGSDWVILRRSQDAIYQYLLQDPRAILIRSTGSAHLFQLYETPPET